MAIWALKTHFVDMLAVQLPSGHTRHQINELLVLLRPLYLPLAAPTALDRPSQLIETCRPARLTDLVEQACGQTFGRASTPLFIATRRDCAFATCASGAQQASRSTRSTVRASTAVFGPIPSFEYLAKRRNTHAAVHRSALPPHVVQLQILAKCTARKEYILQIRCHRVTGLAGS